MADLCRFILKLEVILNMEWKSLNLSRSISFFMPGLIPGVFSGRNDGCAIFRELFFKNPVGMCVLTHPDFEIKLVNESFSELFSLDREKISGELFAVVWKKCPIRDDFFTALRKDGSVLDFVVLWEFSESLKKEIVISAIFLGKGDLKNSSSENNDILITARLKI